MSFKTIGVGLLAIAMITVVAPPALAGTTSVDDSITPAVTTPSVSNANRYRMNLAQDESLDVTLSWADENTDLDVIITAPGGTCEIFPNPELPCLAGAAEGTATAAACQSGTGNGESVGFGPGTESTSHDGGVSGEYSVWVLASTAVPLQTVDYTLTITTSDTGDTTLGDAEPFNLLRSSGHCRGL